MHWVSRLGVFVTNLTPPLLCRIICFLFVCLWASWKQQESTPHMNTQENHWKTRATHEHWRKSLNDTCHTWTHIKKSLKNTRHTWTHKKIVEKHTPHMNTCHTWTQMQIIEKHTPHMNRYQKIKGKIAPHMNTYQKITWKHIRGKTHLEVSCLWFSWVFGVKCDYPIFAKFCYLKHAFSICFDF